MQPSPTPDAAKQEVAALFESLNEDQPRTAHEVAGIFHRALQKLEEAQANESERLLLLYDVRLWFLVPREALTRHGQEKVPRLEERFDDLGSDEAFLPSDSLPHFEARFNGFERPFIKARYADFLAARAARGNGSDARRWVQQAVPNYLLAVPTFAAKEEISYKIEAFKSLDGAAHLALKRAPDLLASVVDALRTYLESAASDVAEVAGQVARVGRWTVEAGWILVNLREAKPDAVADADLMWWEEQAVALARRHAPLDEPFLEQSFWSQAAEAARLRGDAHTRFANLREFAQAKVRQARARAQGPGASFLSAASLMEDAVDYLDRLRSHGILSQTEREVILEEIRRLKLEIRRFYREGEREIGVVSTPLNITPEQIEAAVTPFLEPPTLRECLQRLGASLLPSPQRAEEWANSRQEEGSLMSLLGTSILGDGMNIGSYSSEEATWQVEFNRALDFDIFFNTSLLLPRIFERLRLERGLSPDTLRDYLDESGSIEPDNLPLIERGLERYFAEDFASALHLLVPQLEDVIRHLFERVGLPPAKLADRDTNGWQYETFGALLDRADKELPGLLPRELRVYIGRTLSEVTGWNLRNTIAHGMIKMQRCNRATTETVLHLYLSLALFQEITQLEEEDEPSTTID